MISSTESNQKQNASHLDGSRKTFYLFIIPSTIVLVIFTVVPLIGTFVLSLFGGRGGDLEFAGLQNYLEILQDPTFASALRNTLIFVILTVPFAIFLSYRLSLRITRMESQFYQNLVCVIMFIPCITSPVAYSLFFKQIAYDGGFLDSVASAAGIYIDGGILGNPWAARIYISIICVWAWFGYYVLLFVSAMQTIDRSVIDSARIDGANESTISKKIIFPQIMHIVPLTVVIAVCSSLQIYIEVSLITKGGPTGSTATLSYYLYQVSFTFVSQYGYAATIGMVVFFILVVVGLIFIWGDRHSQEQD